MKLNVAYPCILMKLVLTDGGVHGKVGKWARTKPLALGKPTMSFYLVCYVMSY